MFLELLSACFSRAPRNESWTCACLGDRRIKKAAGRSQAHVPLKNMIPDHVGLPGLNIGDITWECHRGESLGAWGVSRFAWFALIENRRLRSKLASDNEGTPGFEPGTCWSAVSRSNHWAMHPIHCILGGIIVRWSVPLAQLQFPRPVK